MNEKKEMKEVFTIVERSTRQGVKSYWVRVGVGWVNNDGSLNLKLEALPVNGSLQVRDMLTEEQRNARRAGSGGAPAMVE